MRRAAKVDQNHADIVKALRTRGATVQSLAAIGKGCPDLLVGYKKVTILIEVKDGSKPPSQRKLTPDQLDWMTNWAGMPVVVANGIDDVIKLLEAIDEYARNQCQ